MTKSRLHSPPDAPDRDDFWDQVLVTLSESWPPDRWCDVGVVVGCSGGADSVALLRAVAQIRWRHPKASGFLIAAHFNHGLRGAESDADEQFVRQLANGLDLPFEAGRGNGIFCDEATLRDQRQTFLLSSAKKHGARYVALAHTIDDNVETVLHHLMRGTGPRGIAGIAPVRSFDDDFVLVRPLLSVRREALRQGLGEIAQEWREDSSNTNTDYRRNWIRGELIPLIESQYPEAVDAMGRLILGQRDWRSTIDGQAERWLSEHLVAAANVMLTKDPQGDTTIIIAALQQLWDKQNWPRQEMGRPQWSRLAATIQDASTQGPQCERYSLPSAIDVSADEDHVTITEMPRQSTH